MSSEAADKELALLKGVDAMVSSIEGASLDHQSKKEKQRNYENECREKFSTAGEETNSNSEDKMLDAEKPKEINDKLADVPQPNRDPLSEYGEKVLPEVTMLSYGRKLTVLYELLSACLANLPEDKKKTKRQRRGYDARHRVALRLLATWFDVKWIKVVNLCFCMQFFHFFVLD